MNWSLKAICYWFFLCLTAVISSYCLFPLLLIFVLQQRILLSDPRMPVFYLFVGGAFLLFFLVLYKDRGNYLLKNLNEKPEERQPMIILSTDSMRNPVRLDDGSLSTHQLERIYIGPGEYRIIIYDTILDEEIPFDPSRSDHSELKKHLDLYLRNYQEEERVLH